MSVVESGINFTGEQSFTFQKVSEPQVGTAPILGSSRHDSMSRYSLKEPLESGVFRYHRREDLPSLDDDSNPELGLYIAFYGFLETVDMARQSFGEGSDRVAQSAGRMVTAILNTLW